VNMVLPAWVPAVVVAGFTFGAAKADADQREATRQKERRQDQERQDYRDRQATRTSAARDRQGTGNRQASKKT